MPHHGVLRREWADDSASYFAPTHWLVGTRWDLGSSLFAAISVMITLLFLREGDHLGLFSSVWSTAHELDTARLREQLLVSQRRGTEIILRLIESSKEESSGFNLFWNFPSLGDSLLVDQANLGGLVADEGGWVECWAKPILHWFVGESSLLELAM